MSSTIRITFALCTVAFLAACAAKQEEIVYQNEPAVTTDPVFESKWK